MYTLWLYVMLALYTSCYYISMRVSYVRMFLAIHFLWKERALLAEVFLSSICYIYTNLCLYGSGSFCGHIVATGGSDIFFFFYIFLFVLLISLFRPCVFPYRFVFTSFITDRIAFIVRFWMEIQKRILLLLKTGLN